MIKVVVGLIFIMMSATENDVTVHGVIFSMVGLYLVYSGAKNHKSEF
jgi:hypothetical protein